MDGARANGLPSGPTTISSAAARFVNSCGSANRTISGFMVAPVKDDEVPWEVEGESKPEALGTVGAVGRPGAGFGLGIRGANLRAADHSPAFLGFSASAEQPSSAKIGHDREDRLTSRDRGRQGFRQTVRLAIGRLWWFARTGDIAERRLCVVIGLLFTAYGELDAPV